MNRPLIPRDERIPARSDQILRGGVVLGLARFVRHLQIVIGFNLAALFGVNFFFFFSAIVVIVIHNFFFFLGSILKNRFVRNLRIKPTFGQIYAGNFDLF
jgi:hypothetical protein